MRRPIKIRHDEVTQACLDCDHKFTQKPSLQRHIDVVHLQKDICLQCPQCQNLFSYKGTLTRHSKNVHDKVKLNGQDCDFSGRRGRESHKDSVDNILNFDCPICDFNGLHRGSLLLHLRNVHVRMFK